MRWLRAVVLGLLVALLASGCGTETVVGRAQADPSVGVIDPVRESVVRLGWAGAVAYRGTATDAWDHRVTFDLRITNEGAASGRITVGGQPADLLLVRGRMFLRGGAPFWSGHPLINERAASVAEDASREVAGQVRTQARKLLLKQMVGRWAEVPPFVTGVDLAAVSPLRLADTLAGKLADTSGRRVLDGTAQTVRGVDTVRLDLPGGGVWISKRQPYRVVRLTMPISGPDSLRRGPPVHRLVPSDPSIDTDVELDLDYPDAQVPQQLREQLARTAGQLTNSADASLHLAFRSIVAPCAAGGCAAVAVVAAGPNETVVGGTLTVSVLGGGGLLATCETGFGGFRPGGAVTARCFAGGAGWAAFYARATAPSSTPRVTPYYVSFLAFAQGFKPVQVKQIVDEVANPPCPTVSGFRAGVLAPAVCAPLTEKQKDRLRAGARRAWQRTSGGKRASQVECEVHHRIPLEWTHLFPGDPNRLSNLVGMAKGPHNELTQEWNAWKRALGGRSPTAAEVLAKALQLDRQYQTRMKLPSSTSALCY